jgi:two-component system sensor histidine kinase UhpB
MFNSLSGDQATFPAEQRGWILRPRLAGRWLLTLPTFYKVLVANSSIVVLGAIAGTMLTAERVRAHPNSGGMLLVLAFASAGLLLSVACNALVLRAALAPIHQLERAINAVRAGDRAARVRPSTITDADVARVGETLNALLDELELSRRRLKDLSGQVLSAQEDERRRISRELHDDTAQSLTSLALVLKTVEDTEDHPALKEQLRDVRREVEQSIEGVRRLARDLRPSTLDDLGLSAAVDWYVQAFSQRTRLAVHYRSDLGAARLPEAIELALYRIAQEALTNIVKHARASEVQVLLTRTPQTVILRISDNGVGFPNSPDGRSEAAGVGLYGMRERAELIGGRLRLHSGPARGVEIEAEAPLNGG